MDKQVSKQTVERAFKQNYRDAAPAERREIKDCYLNLYSDATFSEMAVERLRWIREVETSEMQTA